MNDEITKGEDILGALIMGHKYNSWWTGSILSIEESRRLVPHQNATTMQVAIGVVAACMWMIENPNNDFSRIKLITYTNGVGTSKLWTIRAASGGGGGMRFYETDETDANLRLIIDNGGKVGIGTTGPVNKLHIVGSGGTAAMRMTDTTAGSGAGWTVGVNNGSSMFLIGDQQAAAYRLLIDGSGNVTGTYGNYHVSSDVRLKKDIVTIPNALEKVLSLRGVNYRWKDSKVDNNLHMGMIAQEVEKVVPEVVHTSNDKMKTKAVEYQFVVGLLVEAIKAQQQQIQDLKQKIVKIEDALHNSR